LSFYQIFGVFIFSVIGLAYFMYAKKRPSYVTFFSALFLMGYSYFFEHTWELYLYGIIATLLPYLNYLRLNR